MRPPAAAPPAAPTPTLEPPPRLPEPRLPEPRLPEPRLPELLLRPPELWPPRRLANWVNVPKSMASSEPSPEWILAASATHKTHRKVRILYLIIDR
ncbi:uncharacterized protein CANTADRAFT_203370 [Suhomyces tanzawaensis NRRL Y-17324]|uniref:Uncharacterized protein n=1 Tax=Suhomyces tanzawaensis NRRL Y-17324 TaxID=984487 RepID=A0A1E4SPE8_9ASCO|nr:uncharacterized protein CANTADRAFT_203370 [Suhomyces tanzawaensis NRRL Y-17324]ODV81262.1 hypothetical protein CANTADRAFT_203370 [Suhomyces tanzawaensis NRRL Y-17324]